MYGLSAGNSSGSAGSGGAPPAPADPALDSTLHMMLEPHLRPISPDLNDEESKRIFDEHKQLAQEYLKVTKLTIDTYTQVSTQNRQTKQIITCHRTHLHPTLFWWSLF